MSYLEIYREELRDLLDGGMGSQGLVIRDNEQGHTCESSVVTTYEFYNTRIICIIYFHLFYFKKTYLFIAQYCIKFYTK